MTTEWKACPTIEDVVEAKKRGTKFVFASGGHEEWSNWDGELLSALCIRIQALHKKLADTLAACKLKDESLEAAHNGLRWWMDAFPTSRNGSRQRGNAEDCKSTRHPARRLCAQG